LEDIDDLLNANWDVPAGPFQLVDLVGRDANCSCGTGIVGFFVVVSVAQKLFGVVEGVGAGLAALEVGWWDPFGVAVGAFPGGPAAGSQ